MMHTRKQGAEHLPSQHPMPAPRARRRIRLSRGRLGVARVIGARGIAALAAAGIALSSAVAAPTALATKIDDGGGYKTKEQRCEEIGGWFDGDVNAAAAADKAGDAAGREAAMSQARLDLALARGAGCDWAARRLLPPANVVAPPIGATTVIP